MPDNNLRKSLYKIVGMNKELALAFDEPLPAHQVHVDQEVDAILDTIISHLPEIDYEVHDPTSYGHAINDVKKLLTNAREDK